MNKKFITDFFLNAFLKWYYSKSLTNEEGSINKGEKDSDKTKIINYGGKKKLKKEKNACRDLNRRLVALQRQHRLFTHFWN